MATSLPPVDTPARKAFLDQGTTLYPGVDQWHHPQQDLPAGTLVVQFDFRPEADIRRGEQTISPYFTDAATLLKHLTPDLEVNARSLAEALQVKPYRQAEVGEHLYSSNVAIYRLIRPIKAEDIQVAQPAEFGHGLTRNNLQYGDGVGAQFFLTEPKDSILKGPSRALEVADVMPCIERTHRLAWLLKLEQSQVDNKGIEAAVKPIFQETVNQLLRGTPAEQQHGREIAGLYQANQAIQLVALNSPVAKVPPPPVLTPTPDPAPPRRRGPRL
ncbi:hypothetical protein [Hymenobacter sp. UYP22]|uniref:hypothetical protein n=1 Tax=Hymenobacter sp. UYP22 TaxID=3156348 RepID=UPI0033954B15